MIAQPFQNFVNDLLQHQVVQEICSHLYEQLNMNPNLLLFCCWYAVTGAGVVQRADLLKAIFLLNKWHSEITLGLSKISRQIQLKPNSQIKAQLYPSLQKAELLADQTEQNILINILGRRHIAVPSIERITDAKTNVATYTKLLNRQLQDKHYQLLTQLLELVFTQTRI